MAPDNFAATYNQLFERSARCFPERVALRIKTPDGYQSTTHGEVWRQSRGMALALSGMGLRPGKRIANLSENRAEWVFAYLGILLAGCTAVPLDAQISAIDAELETHHAELHVGAHSISNTADAMPALGIVAAVLGVIHTMGLIAEPPEILGGLIGAALVGTFFGILMSYGVFAPIANSVNATDAADAKYYQCMKAGLLAHMQGYPPAVSVEFARKVLWSTERPSFYEVEQAVSALPAP